MKKLIIIRGSLGVGKTTISKILVKNLGLVYLSVDKILKNHNLENINNIPLKNFLKSNEIILKLIGNSKKSFIIDGCFYYKKQLEDLKQKLKNNILIFTLVSDVEKCIERDSKREKVYGEDAVRYVHMVTTKTKVGHEIDNSVLSIKDTADKIISKL